MKERTRLIIELRHRGFPLAKIGRIFRITKERVRQLYNLGMLSEKRRRRHGVTDKDPAFAIRVFDDWLRGLGQRALSEKYGLNQLEVRAILKEEAALHELEIKQLQWGWKIYRVVDQKLGEPGFLRYAPNAGSK